VERNELQAKLAWGFSFLLGQASALLGLAVAIGWLFAFALIMSPKGMMWTTHPGLTLPMEPPLIGLLLGAFGLLLARWSRQPVARYSVAGLIFNAVPLVLAIIILLVRAAT